jgi:predicted transcriptional regulator
MIPNKLITESVFAMKTSDTGIQAISWMEEFKVTHLPIVNNEILLGVISENDIFELDDLEAPLGNHKLSLQKPYVYNYEHVYDALRIISANKLSLLPVLDKNNNYIGVICLTDLIHYLAELTSADQPGGLIVLEIDINSFLVSQIGQILEENDAYILSLNTIHDFNSKKIDVFLKVNKTDIRPIIQTFERYSYVVKESIMSDTYDDDLNDRYDSLMHYLNI